MLYRQFFVVSFLTKFPIRVRERQADQKHHYIERTEIDVDKALRSAEEEQTVGEQSQVHSGYFYHILSVQFTEQRSIGGRFHAFQREDGRQKVDQKERIGCLVADGDHKKE